MRSRSRALVVLGTAVAGAFGLGIGLLGVGATAADGLGTSSSTTTTTTSPPSSSPSSSSSSSSSSGSSLGGYETSATGSGITWSYEQPNFPIPATPTLEANLGYSNATYNSGPTGEAVASTVWPGPLVAGGGQQLSTLLQPYIGSSASNLPQPPWPIQATTVYPPAPGSNSPSSQQDAPGVTMEADSNQNAGTATAGFDTSYVGSSGFISVQSVESTVESTVQNGQALSQATSGVHGVSIAGGLITIGQITSTATSTSDGNQAKVTGASTVSQMSVVGEPATLDSSGLHTVGNNLALPGSLLPNVQKELQTAGISMTLTNPTDTVNGASGQRQLDGVEIQIDITTLDKEAEQLVAGLPSQVQQKVIDQLPLAIPDTQILTVDLGWVNVQASASPGYDSGSSSAASSDLGLGSDSGSGITGAGSSGLGATAGFSGSSPGGTGAGGTGSSNPSGAGNGFSPVTSAVPAKLFQGIGAGLIALGVILALLLAGVLWRADRAVGALTAAAPCVGEQPANF